MAFAIVATLIGAGILIGYLTWGVPRDPEPEKPAAPIWHDDGSLTAIRSPLAAPRLKTPSKPPHGKPVRTVEVTVKPDPPKPGATECAPVTLRLDLDRYTDGDRVNLRAENGEILDAADIPRNTVTLPVVTRHVLGLERVGDATTLRYGRTLGRVDIGPSLTLEDGRAAVGGWFNVRF